MTVTLEGPSKMAEIGSGAPMGSDTSVGRGAALAGGLETNMLRGAHSTLVELPGMNVPQIDIKAPVTPDVMGGGAGMKPPETLATPAAGDEGKGRPTPHTEAVTVVAGAELETEAITPGTETAGPKPLDADERKKLVDLKNQDPRTLTVSQLKERNDLLARENVKTPEAAAKDKYDDIRSRMESDDPAVRETVTDEEIEFAKTQEAEAASTNMDAEVKVASTAESIQRNVEDSIRDISAGLTNGEIDRATALDRLKELYDLTDRLRNENNITMEDALMNVALGRGSKRLERKLNRKVQEAEEIMQMAQDVLILEMQAMHLDGHVDALQRQKVKLVREVTKKESLVNFPHRNPEIASRDRSEYMMLLMQLTQVKVNLLNVMQTALILDREYTNATNSIKTKLGLQTRTTGLLKSIGIKAKQTAQDAAFRYSADLRHV